MKTNDFWASLGPQGPRDRASGKERENLRRIASTRALYDQMAPQLCPFCIPRKLSFSSQVFIYMFNLFGVWKAPARGKENSDWSNYIVFPLGPTQTSFSFPPTGTPEATSWEQGQMARPHMGTDWWNSGETPRETMAKPESTGGTKNLGFKPGGRNPWTNPLSTFPIQLQVS